ncbi:MAG: ATP-binding protein [Desulfobacterales bacterium]|nr:ATP-binding protein [Desulfobacterales bacterium]
METKMYAFELKGEVSELKTLRRHLNIWARVARLSKSYKLEVNLSLDELFTNIVSYGYDDDLEHSVSFTLRMDDDILMINIEDDGRPFDPLKAELPKIPVDLADIKIGGLGIFITRKLMDEICYERNRGRNKLMLKKVIRDE